MNLIFITENFFPDVMGGSGRVVAETTKRLAAGGHNVHVVTRRMGDAAQRDSVNGAEVWRYSSASPMAQQLWSLRQTISAATKEIGFDVAVICQPLPGIVAVHHPCLKSIPKTREFYGPWHDEYRVKKTARDSGTHIGVQMGCFLRKWCDVHVLMRVDMIRVLSAYTARMVTDLCPGAGNRIRLIPGGVDTERFTPATDKSSIRRKLGLPGSRRIVFTVRNLTARMGLDVLIDAMRHVADRMKDVLLIIGGEGPLRLPLEDKIKGMNLEENVVLRGRIPDDDLPAFYQGADLFILPTQDLEGFGLVTLEAMACGLPVLATRQGGSVEILGASGSDFLLDGMDSATMASRICELLNQPERMDELGRKARTTILATYSWDRQVEQLQDLFREAIVNRRRADR
jgi:glycosyltransferase involved in cell wall biosynthesis